MTPKRLYKPTNTLQESVFQTNSEKNVSDTRTNNSKKFTCLPHQIVVDNSTAIEYIS